MRERHEEKPRRQGREYRNFSETRKRRLRHTLAEAALDAIDYPNGSVRARLVGLASSILAEADSSTADGDGWLDASRRVQDLLDELGDQPCGHPRGNKIGPEEYCYRHKTGERRHAHDYGDES